MDKKINMIHRLTFSVNPKKYVYLYKEKLSKTFLYILLLSLILGAIQGFMSTAVISTVEKAAKIALKQDELKFEMKDGILDFKASPLKEEEGQVLLLIDTNKNIDEIDSLRNITVHKEIATVLLKDGAMIRSGSNEITYKYSDFGLDKFYFDNDVIVSALSKVTMIKYIIIPFVIIFKFVQILIYALIISLMGILSNLIGNRKMKYSNVLNLSLYAGTLPALINVIYPIGKYTVIIGGIILILGLSFMDFYKIQKDEENNQ